MILRFVVHLADRLNIWSDAFGKETVHRRLGYESGCSSGKTTDVYWEVS